MVVIDLTLINYIRKGMRTLDQFPFKYPKAHSSLDNGIYSFF
jgi:hypothetical protein